MPCLCSTQHSPSEWKTIRYAKGSEQHWGWEGSYVWVFPFWVLPRLGTKSYMVQAWYTDDSTEDL